jgi:uncharacterized SAM-binding protein YcdF (DUF218 family)
VSKVTLKQYLWIFAGIVVVFFVILQGIGFYEYASSSISYQNNKFVPSETDMIVVLAGSSGRINAAYELMKEREVPVLFVAGVYKAVNFEDLAREFKIDTNYRERIKIDNVSRTTLENAKVALQYAEENNIKTIALVTSVYHIKRAEFIFNKVFEDHGGMIIPYSAYTTKLEPNSMWTDYKTFINFLNEYVKYQLYRVALSVR